MRNESAERTFEIPGVLKSVYRPPHRVQAANKGSERTYPPGVLARRPALREMGEIFMPNVERAAAEYEHGSRSPTSRNTRRSRLRRGDANMTRQLRSNVRYLDTLSMRLS